MNIGDEMANEDKQTAHDRAINGFKTKFEASPEGFARAPGRVNLIGEHTDYSGGFVLPMAVDREIVVAFRSIAGDTCRAYSVDYDETSEFSVSNPERVEGHHWSNYLRGVASVLNKASHKVVALEMAFAGDLPEGAGLSSSAAVEVATVMAFDAASGLGINPVEHVKLAQAAEVEFVGVNCGIMDQFVSRLGEENHCLRIDCRDLSYEPFALPSSDVCVIVADSGVSRKLSSGEYNKRRSACESAAAKLTDNKSILLRDVKLEDLLAAKDDLTEIEYNRSLHVLQENARVGLFAQAVRDGNYIQAGKLINDSHNSLKNLFEVSSKELDMLVDIARSTDGVYGSRLTGAGFGGCTMALVKLGKEQDYIERVEKIYPERSSLKTRTWKFLPARGATAEIL